MQNLTDKAENGAQTGQNANCEGKSRILIVDDHPVLRRGISLLINEESDMAVCCEAKSAQEALDLLEKTEADLVLVDISMKGMNGLELIKTIKSKYPDLLTLVLSAHDASRYAERALRAGARGYIMKEENIDVVVTAIRQVLAGNIYLDQDIMPTILGKLVSGKSNKDATPSEILSNRELEVFEMIGKGARTSEIAETLRLSTKTIQVYRENIKKKLGLKDSVKLHQSAFQWCNENAC